MGRGDFSSQYERTVNEDEQAAEEFVWRSQLLHSQLLHELVMHELEKWKEEGCTCSITNFAQI